MVKLRENVLKASGLYSCVHLFQKSDQPFHGSAAIQKMLLFLTKGPVIDAFIVKVQFKYQANYSA